MAHSVGTAWCNKIATNSKFWGFGLYGAELCVIEISALSVKVDL
jgi:hypothetical protein